MSEKPSGIFIPLDNYVPAENENIYQDSFFPYLKMTDLKENIYEFKKAGDIVDGVVLTKDEEISEKKMMNNFREGEIYDSLTDKTYVWRAEYPMIPDPEKPETLERDCMCRDCDYREEAMAYLESVNAKQIPVFCPMFKTHCNWILMRNIEERRGSLVPVKLNLKSSKAVDVLNDLFD